MMIFVVIFAAAMPFFVQIAPPSTCVFMYHLTFYGKYFLVLSRTDWNKWE